MNDLFRVLITVGAVLLLMGLLKINNNRKLKRGFQYPLLFIGPVLVVAEVALLVWLGPQMWQWLSQQSWGVDIYNAIMTPGGTGDKDQDHPHRKEIQKIKMAVWGGLTKSCEKQRSEKERRKGKI